MIRPLTAAFSAALALLALSVSSVSADPASPQGEKAAVDDAIGKALKAHVVPLDASKPGFGAAAAGALKGAFGEARIVGLGEAAHGSREIFLFKHDLIVMLVEQLGFRVFAIEGEPAAAAGIDRYLSTGEGDLAAALRKDIRCWETGEVLALLKWMRRYNEAHPQDPVRFASFDLERDPGYFQASVERLFSRLGAEEGAFVRSHYEGYKDYRAYGTRSEKEKANCREKLAAVVQAVEAKKEAFLAIASPEEYRKLRFHAEVVAKSEPFWALSYQQPEDFARSLSIRDRLMADNVRRLAAQAHAGRKIILWGHNLHIGVHPEMNQLPARSMGHHLRDTFQEAYYALGFTFHGGEIQAKPLADMKGDYRPMKILPAAVGSAESAFAQTGHPSFFLNMRAAAPGTLLGQWVKTPLPVRAIGAAYDAQYDAAFYSRQALAERYDGVIHLSRSHPSTLLPE